MRRAISVVLASTALLRSAAAQGEPWPMPDPLPRILEWLRSDDAEVRRRALRDVSTSLERSGHVLGAESAPGVGATIDVRLVAPLLASLEDVDGGVRTIARTELLRTGHDPLSTFEWLRSALDRHARLAVAAPKLGVALTRPATTWPATELVEPLRSLASDESAPLAERRFAADALGALETGARDALPTLRQLATAADPELAEASTCALAAVGLASERNLVLDAAIARLAATDDDERRLGRRLSSRVGSAASSRTTELVAAFERALEAERVASAGSGTCFERRQEVEEWLTILASLGEAAAPAADAMFALLDSAQPRRFFESDVVNALSKLGPAVAARTARWLVDQLLVARGPDEDLRRLQDFDVLGRLAELGAPARPEIERLLRDPVVDRLMVVDQYAFRTLLPTVAGSEALSALLTRWCKAGSRRWALSAIDELGERGAPFLSMVQDGLASPRPEERSRAAQTAGTLGSAARPLVPKLVELLGDADEDVAQASWTALADLGETARDARARLDERFASFSDERKRSLVTWIGRFGAIAVPWIREFLDHPPDRQLYCRAIEQLGLAAMKDVPAAAELLVARIDDPDPWARSAVLTALHAHLAAARATRAKWWSMLEATPDPRSATVLAITLAEEDGDFAPLAAKVRAGDHGTLEEWAVHWHPELPATARPLLEAIVVDGRAQELVRVDATSWLGRHVPLDELVPLLARVWSDERTPVEVRRAALDTVDRLGRRSTAAAKTIEPLTVAEPVVLRRAAWRALHTSLFGDE